jgi:hypothetical protein
VRLLRAEWESAMPLNNPAIDDYSFRAMRVEMLFNDTVLAIGTAFTYTRDNASFLVTTWHNVTGKHNQTGQLLSPATGAMPNVLRFSLRTGPIRRAEVATENKALVALSLYEADGTTPKWLVHPEHGREVDVIALRLSPETISLPQFTFAPINLAANVDLPIAEGADVFVLGYPEGLTGGLEFPIWKRGTIASIPSLDYDGLPLMLVDTMTGKGMSGAPVILAAVDPSPPILAQQGSGTASHRRRRAMFIGVYSGRLGDSGVKSQLGRIWRAEAIDQIIQGGRRDSNP